MPRFCCGAAVCRGLDYALIIACLTQEIKPQGARGGRAVTVERESEDVFAVAAKGEKQNVMVSYYNDDDSTPVKTVKRFEVRKRHVDRKDFLC